MQEEKKRYKVDKVRKSIPTQPSLWIPIPTNPNIFARKPTSKDKKGIGKFESREKTPRFCKTLSQYSASRSTGLRSQRTRPPRRENPHNTKDNIKQRQRIRDKPTHSTHPCHGTEHPRRAIRAPPNRGRSQKIPEKSIHGDQNTNQCSQHQRQEAISQHAGGAGERQGSREMANSGGGG